MTKQILRRRAIRVAVAAAMPVLLAGGNAYATCTTGSAPATDVNTVTCDEGSTYTNASGTTVSNTATIANAGNTAGLTNSVVQMTGNGSKFTNNGTISNTSTYTNTTTNSGQKFGVYVGAVPATTDELNKILNTGSISAIISDANMQANKTRLNTAAVVGVGTDASGEYELTNSGTISATHNGVGRVNGVEAGGDVESMTITNSGTITGTQSHAITKTTSTATSFQGTVTLGDSSTTSAANIGVAAGIYAEEEVQELVIENSGTISGVGTYASGIYTRAGTNEITNTGTITGEKIGVAQVSDSGEIRTMVLENSGTINGDVMSVNDAALRWWSLSNGEGTGGATIDSRLNINSQWGQANSTITNSGTINGNFYFGNGTHVLTNESEGEITGDIDVDQRNTTCSSCNTPGVGANTTGGTLGVSSTWTVVGTKDFTFENAGAFDGDITVRTASSALLPSGTVTSKITLVPTVTGSGAGSSEDSPSAAVAGMGGTLKIYDGTAAVDGSNSTANLVRVAPKLKTVVHAGEWFKVADTLYGTTLPSVSSINTAMVTWEIAKNTGGNLVIGVEEVKGLDDIGITGEKAKALEALLGYTGDDEGLAELGGALLALTDEDDIKKAAEQLRPEVNNAGMSAAMGITTQVQGVVDGRIGEVHLAKAGLSGIATGEGTLDNGFWLQGFGFQGDQDRRKGVDGYQADAGGIAFGGDTLVNPDLRVGLAFSYGNTSVDAEGVNQGNTTDLDSYQALAYASFLGNGWYLNGSLGFAKHEFDTRRLVTVPLSEILTGSHDAWQYSAKVDAGYPFKMGNSLTLIPMASLAYSYLDQDGYTEKGGAAALSVKDVNTDSIRTGLGAKALVTLSDSREIKAVLEGRAMWFHEFGDDSQDTTASFAAGGGAFTTNGVELDRDAFNVGASLQIAGKNSHQSLTLSYDAEIKDEYFGQTAKLQARFEF